MTAVRTAMLLAAGLGTRMRPLTLTRPKALVEVDGRTLIDRVLDKLVLQGVERAVVNVHHFADQVVDHLSRRHDLSILISDERAQLLETGGGVVKALPLLGKDPFFVINTDVTWDTRGDDSFLRLAERYDPHRMDALLLLADMNSTLGFGGAGDFYRLEDGRLERRGGRERAPYVFAGAYVTSADRLQAYPAEPFSANVWFDAFLSRERLFGEVMSAFWLHVGDPKAREDAERWLESRGEAR